MSKSRLEEAFWEGWLENVPGLPAPEREARFCEVGWRVDFLWREQRVYVAVQGQMWGRHVKCPRCGRYVTRRRKDGKTYRVREAGGSHYRGDRIESDARKYNRLASLGYVGFVVVEPMLRPGRIAETVAMVAAAVIGR